MMNLLVLYSGLDLLLVLILLVIFGLIIYRYGKIYGERKVLKNLLEVGNDESKMSSEKFSRTEKFGVFLGRNWNFVIVFVVIFYFVSQSLFFNHNSNGISNEVETADSLAVEPGQEVIGNNQESAGESQNKNYRNNWSEFITVTRSGFKYSQLGGIYNLEIVLTNKTDKWLETVMVAVDYIKSSGGIYKTEYVIFKDVNPESRMSLPAPDSERGTDVKYRIVSINAPSFNFLWDEDDLVGNGSLDDPWKN